MWTARSSAAHAARRSTTSASCDAHLDHGLPELPTSSTSRAATPRRSTAWSSSRAATSTQYLAGVPPVVVESGAHEHGRRASSTWTSTATTPASSPIRFYGYDPDGRRSRSRTTSYAAFLQDEWSFNDQLEADRRPALLERRPREGAYFGLRAGSYQACRFRSPSSSTRTRSSRTRRTRPACSSRSSDADATFDDFTARLELD